MKRLTFLLLFAAAWLVFAPILVAPLQAQDLPDGAGKDLDNRVCTQCHGLEQVVVLKQSKAEWNALVDTMIQYGATAKDEEFDAIVDYLAKNFGKGGGGDKVNVNKAAAKDIETGLALTTTEAEAIVAYRQKNGDFKTLQDLLKVTGVDAKKIEAAKDKIDF